MFIDAYTPTDKIGQFKITQVKSIKCKRGTEDLDELIRTSSELQKLSLKLLNFLNLA